MFLDYEYYNQYMKSDEWKRKRAERLKIDKYRCQGCGAIGTRGNPLTVHHITYFKNGKCILGNENVKYDLVTCCTVCHRTLHNVMDRARDERGRTSWFNSMWYRKKGTNLTTDFITTDVYDD